MSLRFKTNQLAHIGKQICVTLLNVQRPVIFYYALSQEKVPLVGWVCWPALSVAGGPHSLTSVALAFPLLVLAAGNPNPALTFMAVPFFLQPKSLNIILLLFSFTFWYFVSDDSFIPFPNKDFCCLQLRSFQKQLECQQVFYDHEVFCEQSNLQPFLE